MSTPKLKLHSLSANRPAPSDAQLLTFFRGTHLLYDDLEPADGDYIQRVSSNDYNRFYLSVREVSGFLLAHDLLETPAAIDYETLAYKEAHKKWLESPASTGGSIGFAAIRKAFIQAHVEHSGFTFDIKQYNLL